MVRLEAVTKRFGETVAVDNVSLEVQKGEFLTLLGPSGCGKTTTLRMIAGFEKPTCGSIYINDRPVDNLPPYKREVNTVFQNYALFPHMKVKDNVAFGLRIAGLERSEIKRRVDWALDLVQLTSYGDRYPHQLSGGQQQRVALARAIVCRPRVLLLDEPLGALDLKLRKEMQLELKSLQRHLEMTFIHVTHDQEEALIISDRIAVMESGAVHQVASAAEVYEKPATLFVAQFIGDVNILKVTVADGDGDEAYVQGTESKIPIAVEEHRRYAPGQVLNLAVRPEHVRIGERGARDTGEPQAVLGGVVNNLLYLGSTLKVQVVLPGGDTVTAAFPNSSGRPEFRAGDQVCLSWPVSAGRLLGQ
ncbi:MAG TPA: ABC transporter ATP-binding protein [Firmicutes bacterium]|nr:ABC transporter ATP-binding protein [Bacillota bacterium]